MSKYKDLLIKQSFSGKVIGSVSVDVDELPLTPDFVFSIGYKALLSEDGTPQGAFDLDTIAVVSDYDYVQYVLHGFTKEQRQNLINLLKELE
jgi:hypothetical protein